MDARTVAVYDEMAGIYDEETREFWDTLFPRSIIDAFTAQVRGTVLDIGSGPGRDASILAGYGLDIVCLDASEAMVGLSAERGFRSVKGDLLALPFGNGSFDGVWAYTSLLHVKKHELGAALAEVRRVLKESGVFGLGMIEGDAEEYRKSSEMGKERLFSFYKKEELERALGENGFEIMYFEAFKPKSKNYLNFICKKK